MWNVATATGIFTQRSDRNPPATPVLVRIEIAVVDAEFHGAWIQLQILGGDLNADVLARVGRQVDDAEFWATTTPVRVHDAST
jgi:hypothetical protein